MPADSTPTQRAARPPGRGTPESAGVTDMVVSPGPWVSLTIGQIAGNIPAHALAQGGSELQRAAVLGSGANTAAANTLICDGRSASRWGVREFLAPEEGSGYMDNFRPLRHTVLSISHLTYRERTWAIAHGEGMFKLRILLSGRLVDRDGKPLLESPAASISIHPRRFDTGYFIVPDIETKLVILHCYPEVLSETMALPEESIPKVLSPAAVLHSPAAQFRKFSLGPKVFDAAMDIVHSRYEYPGMLRANFLEAKCRELLCSVINELKTAEVEQRPGPRLAARDLNRVLEARDYLSNHFRAPPSIRVLARRVGVNQTKLKESFRQVTGTTLHAFVQDIRMRRASEMLLTGEHTISEVAYAVGYLHPANFSSAFRRYYGFLPRALKPRS